MNIFHLRGSFSDHVNHFLIPHSSDTHQDNCSRGCRTPAWVLTTAGSAEAGMAARAGCRRRVCGAGPQDVRLLMLRWEPAGLQVDGLDLEDPDQRTAAWCTPPPSGKN